MLSKIKCGKCEDGRFKLHSDPHGTYYLCTKCGAQRGTSCPHCKTSSIIVRSSQVGNEILCKACGCSNNELAREVCAKNRQPGLVMV